MVTDRGLIATSGIAGIVIIESIALVCGVDGAALVPITTTVAGIVGGALGFGIGRERQDREVRSDETEEI